MPQRSTIQLLPTAAREWLLAELARRNFAGYGELVADFERKLPEFGVAPDTTVTRSALHRFGQAAERRIARLRASTEMAKTIVAQVGDEEGALHDASLRLLQNQILGVLCLLEAQGENDDVEEDDEKKKLDLGELIKALSQLSHAVSDISRASVNQQKWMRDVKERIDKATKTVEKSARAEGLSEEAIERFKREMLGIV